MCKFLNIISIINPRLNSFSRYSTFKKMDKIIHGLFLGGYEDATDTEMLNKHNITHILTVHELKLSRSFRTGFQYMFLETKPTAEIDLLSKFVETNEFITNGIKSGGVLVHCQFGMARSATIVLAYIMFLQKCSTIKALEIVKNRRNIICPTDSFMYQLKLFEIMDYQLNLSFQIYRLYKNYFVIANKLDKSQLVFAGLDKNRKNYKCSHCQSDLFNQDNISFHLTDENDLDFLLSSYFDSINDDENNKQCSENNLYIELMDWMSLGDTQANVNNRDLKCPNCSSRIGSISLNGENCSCGNWMFPSVFIDRFKIIQ